MGIVNWLAEFLKENREINMILCIVYSIALPFFVRRFRKRPFLWLGDEELLKILIPADLYVTGVMWWIFVYVSYKNG